MSREPSFGVITVQNMPWTTLVEAWKRVEQLGFDHIWVADHFVNFDAPHDPWFESWTLLAALACHTSRIRIGSLVTAVPFHNPAILARQALTVDHISNGRLTLGLGAGIPGRRDPSYAMTGTEDWSSAERVGRVREFVEIVDRLLCQGVTSYQGRYYHVDAAVMQPGPVQRPRPPITIAAFGKSMLRIAARHADTWNMVHMLPSRLSAGERLERTRHLTQALDAHCIQAGRDPSTLRRSVYVGHVKEELPYDSVAAFVDDVGHYQELGIDEFIVNYPIDARQIPLLERIALDALPQFRS